LGTTLGQIGIIGSGSWGTALAKILTDNGHIVHWWVRKPQAVQHLLTRHHNPDYLTSVSFLPETIMPTSDLGAVVRQSDTLLISVPSAYVLDVIAPIAPETWHGKKIISAIKGILPGSNQLLNDYLSQRFGFSLQQYIAITGPCHAEEVAGERLSYLTFSGLSDSLTSAVSNAFCNTYINGTTTHDIWGAQFAAVLKNIYAIGAGISRSLDYGDNFLSVYTTNCYREMYRFLCNHFQKVHPSPQQPDFHTSAYLGDLLVTCYSLHSRNRTFGAMIGKGYSVKSASLEMNMVAEGYYASRGMHQIAKELQMDMPIADIIYRILWENLEPADGFISMEKLLS
jgi:glycerol-3-phosphate dehydrogenase (NAD(P)+)